MSGESAVCPGETRLLAASRIEARLVTAIIVLTYEDEGRRKLRRQMPRYPAQRRLLIATVRRTDGTLTVSAERNVSTIFCYASLSVLRFESSITEKVSFIIQILQKLSILVSPTNKTL